MAMMPWALGGYGGLGRIPSFGYDDPFFSGIERAMDRAMTRAYDPAASGGQGSRSGGALVPNFFRTVAGGTPMDISESDKEYIITADAPGFSPDEVSVEEHDGVLMVRGAKEETREERDKAGNILRQERSYRNFSRSFTLPDTVQADNIHASLDRGVLNVHIPKLETAKKATEPRRITVGSGTPAPAAVNVPSGGKASGEETHPVSAI